MPLVNALGCFRHQLLLCRHRHPVIDHAQDDCANLTFSDNQRSIVVGKISLNVSRRIYRELLFLGIP
jgi:hypothetical protein